jgi:hypothetical protein
MANYLRRIKGGVTLAAISETVSGGRNLREEEYGSDEWDPLGGEREGGRLDWAGLGASWACWLPSMAQLGCWLLPLFFLSVFFFFCF